MRRPVFWLLPLCCVLLGASNAAKIPEHLPGAPALPESLRAELAAALSSRGSDYVPRTRNRNADGSPQFTNRLLLETSPYLLQHAHNPVNWYPWGDEAFAEAKRLNRPVLVSIGYSTCHWCHVMEDESFDDPELAKLLNGRFVAVKVDREVRPDVDAIYMTAVHAMGQRGGWPLNVWMTPDRRPFYAGTYFPPSDRGGRPGLPRVLTALSDQYREDPGRFQRFAASLESAIAEQLEGVGADSTRVPDEAALRRAARQTASRMDREWGGIGSRTKFPGTVPLRFLLRYHRRSGDPEALELAVLTLEKMATGGMNDHVGGGFHRYSVDRRWLVPHFEKMLYDNALLVPVYVEAWQVTGRADFAAVAQQTLDYVLREMTAPEGGFYSATDADSPGPEGEAEEGWFFTWTPDEIEAVLGAERAAAFIAWYGVTLSGNFEGRNILHAWRPAPVVAAQLKTTPEALAASLEAARKDLYEARLERPPPLRDDKILAAWNGLMISALARAGLAFDDETYTQAARRAADFVLTRMRADGPDGRLFRTFLYTRAAGPAFLEDYAFVIAGLLDLYEASPDPRWIREALALQRVLDTHYLDDKAGAYFKTADDAEHLIAREKPSSDGAVPSGNSVAALNLLRLTEFTGDETWAATAAMIFSAFFDPLNQHPAALGELLLALDYHLDAPKEVVLVAPASGDGLEAMLKPLRRAYLPNRILAVVSQGEDLERHAEVVPLVAGKRAQGGRTTAYVCENRVCAFPTSDPQVFAEQLAEVERIQGDPVE